MTTLPTIHIYGRTQPDSGAGENIPSPTPGVGGLRKPLSVRFALQVSSIEKWVATKSAVLTEVRDYATRGILPGSGSPTVSVTDASDGYAVSISYPDSYSDISALAAKTAIEGINPRLKGRVSNVVVRRA